MILLDTNVVSEGMRSVPNEAVRLWLNAQPVYELYLCTPVLAELKYGVELLPLGKRRSFFEQALSTLEESFADRILPLDREGAHEYGRLMALRDRKGRATGSIDGLIAAIAKTRQASIATRNMHHFDELGIELINPFSFTASTR